jgi:hypothetical protein
MIKPHPTTYLNEKAKVEGHMQIQIMTELIAAGELKSTLEDQLAGTEGVALEIRESEAAVRGVDPTILVALVGAGGTAFGALLAGIFKIMEAKYARKIVINGSQGRRVELSGEFTKEQVDELVRQAREIDVEQIYIR